MAVEDIPALVARLRCSIFALVHDEANIEDTNERTRLCLDAADALEAQARERNTLQDALEAHARTIAIRDASIKMLQDAVLEKQAEIDCLENRFCASTAKHTATRMETSLTTTDIPEQGQNQTPREARQNHLASLRMRLQTAGDLPDLPAQEALWLINEINTLEGAIELLKEDRTQAADALTQATDALEAQAKEIERLNDRIKELENQLKAGR